MIFFDLDENSGVLTLRPQGKLETQDFLTISEAIDPYIKKGERWRELLLRPKNSPDGRILME